METELVCDYLLYKLNKEAVFNYVNRYNLPMRKPTNSIHDLGNCIMERFKMTERATAYDAFLRDFRDGKLGNITFDDSLPTSR